MKTPDGIFSDPLYARSRKVHAADEGAPRSRVVWLEDAQAQLDAHDRIMAATLRTVLNLQDADLARHQRERDEAMAEATKLAADLAEARARVAPNEEWTAALDDENDVLRSQLSEIKGAFRASEQQLGAAQDALAEWPRRHTGALAAVQAEVINLHARLEDATAEVRTESAHAEKWHQVAVTGGKRMGALLAALELIAGPSDHMNRQQRALEALDAHRASIQAAPLGPLPDTSSPPLVVGGMEDGWPSEAEPERSPLQQYAEAAMVSLGELATEARQLDPFSRTYTVALESRDRLRATLAGS